MKIGTAGTFESNDCIVTVRSHQGISILIDSIVFDQFGDQIEQVIRATLEQEKIKNLHVQIKDKGALDYTIRARLLTAIQRMRDQDET